MKKPKAILTSSADLSPESKAYEEKTKLGVVALDFKLYIEGVEVPFESISITTSYGSMPIASITVPYMPYLQEIARNYPAKVHIFFKDVVSERYYYQLGKEATTEKYQYRLLFSGAIKGAYYQKSKSALGGSTQISFQCVHKNYVAADILMSFASFTEQDATRANFQEVAGSNSPTAYMTPQLAAQKAMMGIDISGGTTFSPAAPTGNTDLDATHGLTVELKPYRDQFAGMGGVPLALWNILQRDSYQFAHIKDYMKKIYIPLISNIKYFEGMSGHPLLETYLHDRKQQASQSVIQPGVVNGFLNPIVAYDGGTNNPLEAAAVDATLKAVQAGIQRQKQGAMPFTSFIAALMSDMFYDVLTLNSPVMRVQAKAGAASELGFSDSDEAVAPIETIIKPVMNLYFSPKCNVIYPNMYSAISINDLYDDAPTRVMANNGKIIGEHDEIALGGWYRAPFNVRDAVRQKAGIPPKNILETVGTLMETPASHEMGRGVHPSIKATPQWVMYMLPSAEQRNSVNLTLQQDWRRLVMDYTDFQYSTALSSYRTGSVSCCFNPYIVVGYAMDIIDPSRVRPSHHALCVSVTHSITPRSVNTEVTFSNAITYEELQVFDTPAAIPWVAELLKISRSEKDSRGADFKFTSLMDASKEARNAANKFYEDVLGVGAAFIDDLSEYVYSDDKPKGVKSVNKTMSSLEDSLAACRRSIQTQASVEKLFGMKFIGTKLPDGMADAGNVSIIRDYPLRPAAAAGGANASKFSTSKVRPGHNMFLDYSKFKIEPSPSTGSAPKASSTTLKPGSVDVTGVNTYTAWDVRTDWEGSYAKVPASHQAVMNAADAKLAADFPYYVKGLLKQIIFAESSFVAGIVATKVSNPRDQARGYGQLIPRVWDGQFSGKLVEKLTPEENIRAAASILGRYMRRFGNINDAAVAYHNGETALAKVKKEGGGVADYSKLKADKGGAVYFGKIFQPKKATQ